MKIKTTLLTAILATLFLAVAFTAAQAADQCASATITQTGVYSYSNNSRIVYATCDIADTWEGERMFYIPNGKYDDTMYAAALTALATGYKVDLTLSKFKEGSLIRGIVVMAE